MRLLKDRTTWTRRGFALLWGADALATLAEPAEVVSIRKFYEWAKNWGGDLPSGDGSTLIVAGVEGCLDALSPEHGEQWLERDLKPRMLSFQDEYERQAGLIFWLPAGRDRVVMKRSTEHYLWRCAPPATESTLELGRILWAGAESDAGRILDPDQKNQDPDGPAWIGLHHPRIS